MSAGIVSGLAAIVRSTHPDWASDVVANQIVATATEIPGQVPLRIDAYIAVTDT
jgi:subtilisin family serine protease